MYFAFLLWSGWELRWVRLHDEHARSETLVPMPERSFGVGMSGRFASCRNRPLIKPLS